MWHVSEVDFCWCSVDGLRPLGLRRQSVQAMLLVAVPPVVEGSSRRLRGGAYLADGNPFPTFSDAPTSQLENVSCFLHVGTPRFLALNMCAICDGITDFEYARPASLFVLLMCALDGPRKRFEL